MSRVKMLSIPPPVLNVAVGEKIFVHVLLNIDLGEKGGCYGAKECVERTMIW